MTDVFDLRTLEAEATREPLRFILPSGREAALPHIADLTLRQQRAIDDGRIEDVVGQVVDQDAAEELRDARGTVTAALHVKWLQHAGHKPGESEASSR